MKTISSSELSASLGIIGKIELRKYVIQIESLYFKEQTDYETCTVICHISSIKVKLTLNSCFSVNVRVIAII